MILYGELKFFKSKALVSGDKSIELKIYAIANSGVDTNELQNLLLEPLQIELKRYEITGKDMGQTQDKGLPDLSIMG
jgi:hypothetical protein